MRKACEDLLPADIVWRDKEQFDEGSGTVNLLSEIVAGWMPVAEAEAERYAKLHPECRLRSPEECLYHKILCDPYTDPSPIIENVARWTDRLAAG